MAKPMPGEERILALLAPRFAVRQQVDQNHCTNLRIASPQAVRYDGASRRSLPSRTALPNFMFSNGLTTRHAKPVTSLTRSRRPDSDAVPPASIT